MSETDVKGVVLDPAYVQSRITVLENTDVVQELIYLKKALQASTEVSKTGSEELSVKSKRTTSQK